MSPTPCPVGFYCPSGPFSGSLCPKGSYCVSGATSPVLCPEGTYGSMDGLTSSACNGACLLGFYCVAGTVNPVPCPAGTFGSSTGLKASVCSGKCVAGYYCLEGSTSGTQNTCGSVTKYCPEGASAPLSVRAGYYTDGGTLTTRTSEVLCPLGSYCEGDGYFKQCGAGLYGSVGGLSTPSCSGQCSEGFYCPMGSINATAVVSVFVVG